MANTPRNQNSFGVELPKSVEYVVFLFLYLFDNCCNSFSPDREDRVSEFSAI